MDEYSSLNSLVNISNDVGAIIFVGPRYLKKDIISKLRDLPYLWKYKSFNENYFKSTKTYNNLLLSKGFYLSFLSFTHILIFQDDAWIFKNEIIFWAKQNYSYIGAPASTSDVFGEQNGGVSLRNVKDHFRVLCSFKSIVKHSKFDNYNINKFDLFKKFKKYLLNRYFFAPYVYKTNEDIFWSSNVPKTFDFFKIPTNRKAALFSLELNSKFWFQKTKTVPFACHGWNRNDNYYLSISNDLKLLFF